MKQFTLQDFVTRSQTVKAVQVTAENLAAVANWSSGSVVDYSTIDPGYPSGSWCGKFIEFVGRERKPRFAYIAVGDWMVFSTSQGDFRMVDNETFERDYLSVPSAVTPNGLRRAAGLPMPEMDESMSTRERVNVLVQQAMKFQDRISHAGGDTQEGKSVAEFVTDCIMRLYE